MRQVRRRGSRIKWFDAALDNGMGELHSVNDGPQRRMTEEIESVRSTQGILLPLSIGIEDLVLEARRWSTLGLVNY